MNNEQWERIRKAKELLGLDDRAALADIKRSYRRLAKKHHPDAAKNHDKGQPRAADFLRLTEAYQTLLDYCAKYRFPLTQDDDGSGVEPEDWWMDRFGHDPLWGKAKR
jgi:DnaJ-class molecular chaperone